MAKTNRSEFTANGMMALAPTRERAYDVLVANGFTVGHNFARPVPARKPVAQKSFMARMFKG